MQKRVFSSIRRKEAFNTRQKKSIIKALLNPTWVSSQTGKIQWQRREEKMKLHETEDHEHTYLSKWNSFAKHLHSKKVLPKAWQ